MGAPAVSLVTERHEPGHFSSSWRGYDRAEVDAFLERTAADRQRLQDDLAQVEAVLAGHDVERRHELERLAALRRELARCLETSINALHVANLLLVSPGASASFVDTTPGEGGAPQRCDPSESSRPLETPAAWPLPAWLSPARTLALVGVVPAAVVMLSALAGAARASGDDRHEAGTPVAGLSLAVAALEPLDGTALISASEPIRIPRLPGTPAPRSASAPATPNQDAVIPWGVAAPASQASDPTLSAPSAGDLVLTLTAMSECWIRSTIDGGEPRERLLQPNQSITLRASDEAVLRVGDPAALLLQINGRPAKTLGTAGRAVTARITRANYLQFLSGN